MWLEKYFLSVFYTKSFLIYVFAYFKEFSLHLSTKMYHVFTSSICVVSRANCFFFVQKVLFYIPKVFFVLLGQVDSPIRGELDALPYEIMSSLTRFSLRFCQKRFFSVWGYAKKIQFRVLMMLLAIYLPKNHFSCSYGCCGRISTHLSPTKIFSSNFIHVQKLIFITSRDWNLLKTREKNSSILSIKKFALFKGGKRGKKL